MQPLVEADHIPQRLLRRVEQDVGHGAGNAEMHDAA